MPVNFYCSRCGGALQADAPGQEVVCGNCGNKAKSSAAAAVPPATPPAAPPAMSPPAPKVALPSQALPPAPAPVMPPAVQPTYVPPPPKRKKSACFAACCAGAVVMALVAIAAGAAAYFIVWPKILARKYVAEVRPLHADAIAKISALESDPAIKKLSSITVTESNLASTTKTMIDLASVCTDARHSADAVNKKLQEITAPDDLGELHAALIDYYGAVTSSLEEVEPQIDYMALVLDAWNRSVQGLSEAKGTSSSDPDKIAGVLEDVRTKLKETHDTLMVKAAPPGSEDLHKTMIKSLEDLSSLLMDLSSALRNRNYSRAVSLASGAQATANQAAQRIEVAFTAWSAKMGKKFATLGATLTEKEHQINMRVTAANEKIGLKGDEALPLFPEEKK